MTEEVVPILRVADAEAAGRWYSHPSPTTTLNGRLRRSSLRLGFAFGWEHRFEPGFPAFVEVHRGPVRLFLSEHTGDARPDTLVYLRLNGIDAVAAEFGVPVEEAPWGRELELRDPDGNRLRIGEPAG